jgi:probable rRNA maturation factor
MILLENQTNFNIDTKILNSIVNYLNISKDIELLIVNNKNIRSLNREYRDKDIETDVLSFPLEDIDFMPLGSIVISIDKAKEMSELYKHCIDNEIALLFTHGLLHLLGYDHEIDNGEMRKKEQEIIEYFNLPKSLIVRAKGE